MLNVTLCIAGTGISEQPHDISIGMLCRHAVAENRLDQGQCELAHIHVQFKFHFIRNTKILVLIAVYTMFAELDSQIENIVAMQIG